MEIVADLHLHSKYSRAVSRDMNLQNMAMWASKKGLNILSTGDWTHPLWFREIKAQLVEKAAGLFALKSQGNETRFLLSVEISSIYSQNGKVHRIHNLVWSPSFQTCEKIISELIKRGCNLSSDGRPIIGLSSKDLAELVFSIDENAVIIPCHIWTPWFSLYGSNSGFDSIDECFGKYSNRIFAVETGLSSDPFMNWQIKELDNRSLVSFSDAHSLPKMGREATVFVKKNALSDAKQTSIDISYYDIVSALKQNEDAKFKIGYTIEFYPEEGKYHYTGHRNCNFVQTPQQTRITGNICPICKRKLTGGVLHRVEELTRKDETKEVIRLNSGGVKWILDDRKVHPPFVKLVPLNEIIAESLYSTVTSQKVISLFNSLCLTFGSEINILLKIEIEDIKRIAGDRVAEGISKVRRGDIVILPGYDGQYGIVKIWDDKKINVKNQENVSQLGIDF